MQDKMACALFSTMSLTLIAIKERGSNVTACGDRTTQETQASGATPDVPIDTP